MHPSGPGNPSPPPLVPGHVLRLEHRGTEVRILVHNDGHLLPLFVGGLHQVKG